MLVCEVAEVCNVLEYEHIIDVSLKFYGIAVYLISASAKLYVGGLAKLCICRGEYAVLALVFKLHLRKMKELVNGYSANVRDV